MANLSIINVPCNILVSLSLSPDEDTFIFYENILLCRYIKLSQVYVKIN